MPRFEIDVVKSAAEGRWPDIICQLGSVSADLLDGRQHPCPKQCYPDSGGTDRFRALNDFQSTGALYCNRCHSSGNGDGLAALQWLTGKDFSTVLADVASFVGVKPLKGKKAANPAEHLEFIPWNSGLVSLWCINKPPIQVRAIERLGGRVAKYRGQYPVVAIPVWGPALDAELPRGWVIYRADGGKLPKFVKKGEPPAWCKVKLTAGSEAGVIVNLDDWRDQTKRVWIKCEGPSDLATALSFDWPDGMSWFTTANGAKEKPLDWIVERFRDNPVWVVHDCDRPGQDGATWVPHENGKQRAGWCPSLAAVASEVKNIQLPFPIEPDNGSDLRDYLGGGHTPADFIQAAEQTAAWKIDPADDKSSDTWIAKAEDDPSYLAEVNLRKYRDAGRNLIQWRGEWFQWKDRRYEPLSKSDLRIRIRKSVQQMFERQWKEGKQDKPAKRVSRSLVDEVIDATASQSYVDSEVNLGDWIAEKDGKWDKATGPSQCIALQNGILDLDRLFAGESGNLEIQHTPRWFSTNCLPYAFDSKATCPTWLQFLDDAFNSDEFAIETLQKWFGYNLVPDMSLEKIMFIIGEKRSGKGTILRTLREMLGENAVASPSLNALAGQYQLHSLIGKSAVVIPDVRLSRRSDNVVITERLLSISGGDPQDIERKYLDTLSGVQLQCRFTLFSNLLPQLEDHSEAFVSRCIFLSMPNSFYGREDLTLFSRIKQEMSGVLNWAILGQHKLRQKKVIEQPESGRHLERQMRSLVSPVSLFLQDRVEIVSTQERSISVHELYESWCEWCKENDRVRTIDQEQFRSQLRAVHPNAPITVQQYAGKRESRVLGMALKHIPQDDF